MSCQIKGAQNITPKKKKKVTMDYTLCDVNNEDALRHNVTLSSYENIT